MINRLPTEVITSNTRKVPRAIALSCIAGQDSQMSLHVACGAYTRLVLGFSGWISPFSALPIGLKLMSTSVELCMHVQSCGEQQDGSSSNGNT